MLASEQNSGDEQFALSKNIKSQLSTQNANCEIVNATEKEKTTENSKIEKLENEISEIKKLLKNLTQEKEKHENLQEFF